MASTLQIVPRWKHSYVETFVYDNTEIADQQAQDVSNAVKTMHVFRSSRGIDNLLVKKLNATKFADEFGKTDYKKYGQALMMPYASLNGGAVTSNMRLMPHDATYANSNLFAYYRITEKEIVIDDPNPGIAKMAAFSNAGGGRRTTFSNITTPTDTTTDETGGGTSENGTGLPDIGEGEVEFPTDPDTTPDTPVTPPAPAVKKVPVFQVMFRSIKVAPEVDSDTNRLVAGGATGLRTKKDIDAMAKSIVKPIAGRELPADGSPVPSWNGKYIGTFYTTGRGVYGNNYRWRVVKNTDYEKDYEREMYTFEILTTEGGLKKVAAYIGSLQDIVLNENSVRIDDVLGSYSVGSYPVAVTLDDTAILDIYEAYVRFLEGLASTGMEVTIPTYEEFDPLFGQYIKTSEPYEYYEVVSVDNDAYPIVDDPDNCVVDSNVGVPLGGGYEGLFSTFKNPETGETEYGPTAVITNEIVNAEGMDGLSGFKVGETTVEGLLYVKAFNGKLDRKILSTIRVPSDYICDGNYPYEGKMALAKLLAARWDCLGYFDCGLGIESFSDATLNDIKNRYDGIFKTNAVSKNVQKFQVKDPFTKRWVWVSQTYKIAEQLPVHIRERGIHEAFAKEPARYTGIRPDTVTPSIDLWENELMSNLAERRLNYIEAIDENVYQRGIQNTSQQIKSDLLEENNMHVLFWLKRNIERDVFDHNYRFSDPTERATFRQVEMAKYEKIIGTMVSSMDIKFDMNQYETEHQIIHCYVEVVFRTMSKQGIIEIDINKRSYEMTLAVA